MDIAKVCDYGCGQEAKHQLKNGKWCCSENFAKCLGFIKKNTGNKRPRKIRKEKPEFCDYGCGKPAIFYFKNVNKWCCSKSQNSCEKNKSKDKKTKYFKIENLEKQLCDYGCGKVALFQIGNKKRLCCSKNQNSCKGMKNKNCEKNKGRNHIITKKRKPVSEEIKRKMSESQKKSRLDPNSFWNSKEYDIIKEKQKIEMLNGRAKKLNSYLRLNIEETKEKIRKIREEKGQWLPQCMYSDFQLYTSIVLYYTNISSKKKYTKIELKERGNKKGEKHLDHNFSISKGFKFGILPSIIGSKSNIRLVDNLYNRKKLNKCDITLEKLFVLYKEEIKNENN